MSDKPVQPSNSVEATALAVAYATIPLGKEPDKDVDRIAAAAKKLLAAVKPAESKG